MDFPVNVNEVTVYGHDENKSIVFSYWKCIFICSYFVLHKECAITLQGLNGRQHVVVS